MVLTNEGYRPRLVDKAIADKLSIKGAVCIEGPKWCGKTWTACNHANSITDISDSRGDFQNRKLAELDANLVLEGDRPHLIDEWQDVPKIWDAVRTKVSSESLKGAFLLTGSSTPSRKGVMHSGTGRIATIRMRTMSLYESGDSTGAVSVSGMFGNRFRNHATGEVDLRALMYLTLRGGWPDAIGIDADRVSDPSRDYLDSIMDEDFTRIDGVKRDPEKVRRLITAIGRNESTVVSNRKLIRDLKQLDGYGIDPDTFADYYNLLRRMFLVEEQNAFNPGLRSSTRVGKSPKRHLVDPSLSAAAIGATIDSLMKDLNTYGFLFESMCERDLLVYAETFGGELRHYRDSNGKEIDAIVRMPDDRWGAFEIKLGMNQVDEASENLLKLDERFRRDGRPPEFLCVITGLSSYAYRREDGVYVVPITALGP